MSRSQLVPLKAEGVVFEVLIEGATPSVVLVHSARRGAADFAVSALMGASLRRAQSPNVGTRR